MILNAARLKLVLIVNSMKQYNFAEEIYQEV